MPIADPRVDAYMARSEPFARPILKHLRKLVHATCPDVEETLKWRGVKVPKARPKRPRSEIGMPPALASALKRNKKARTTFDAFSPSHQREYMEWIGEAKTDATRDKRLQTTLEWLVAGKSRNWKYAKK